MNEKDDLEIQEVIKWLEQELQPIEIDPEFRQRLLEDLLELQKRLHDMKEPTP